ncbi:hypothetical protein [Myroides pelagicus]|uniref:Uncharacterized protein n=1 Tax=Myroides pelagicus TaxID=270914 RepID=A0A7K1GLJ3_9FLAO|nr:hypothetical protein [Myroides pelagicus]MTH29727.1 hypothetical protein [Myroides pelagicus]
MKKRLLSVALLMGGSIAAYSQVGIGTVKPNKSAELTIESSKRGVLIPRLGLTGYQDRTTIVNFPTNGINSLLVFNTATVEEKGKEKGLTPGFYYWFIDQWVRIPNEKDIPQIVINEYKTIFGNTNVVEQIQNIVNTTQGNVVYEGDKFYHINKEGEKVEIKDKVTSIAYEEASGDYIYYNEKAVDRNGEIIGQGVRIKIKETVINKFGDIINNKNVQKFITDYLDGTYVGGNVYYDGTSFTYITKEGETKNITIKDIVQGNESQTQIITVDKKQYYVSEEYLIANNGVVPTNVDPKNLPAGIYAIDVVGGVVNNFEEIVNNGPIQVDGRTYPTVNDYITYLTESTGGFTKIVYDQKTGDVIFQEWNETTQKFENVDNAKFSTIVKDNETLTVLVDNGDGTLSYTDEKGKTVTFDSNKTNVEVTDSVYTFKNGKGEVIAIIDTKAKAISYDNSKSGITAENVQDALDQLADSLLKGAGVTLEDKNDGKVTLVADNGTVLGSIDKSKLTEDATNKGLFTFTRNDGTDVVFDVNTVNVAKIADANGNISYLFKDSKGATLTTIDSTADVVSNLTKKGDIYTEIINILEEETDSLTHLGNGKYKHISADETPVEFDVNTVNVSEAKDAAGNVIGYDFKDADGNVITTVKTAASNNYYNDSTTNLGFTTVQGAIEKLLEKVTTVEGTKGDLALAGGLEFTAATDGTAKLLADAGIQIADSGVSTEKIADNAVTSDKLNAGKGADGRVGVAGADGAITYQTLDSVVKGNETVTVLVENTDGTYTYYNEKQIGADGKPKAGETGVTIDPKQVSVALNTTTNKYEFKDSKGEVIGEIDANASSIAFNKDNTTFTSTNVQDALVELLNKITTVEGTKGSLTSTSIYVDGGANALLKDAKLDLRGGTVDGQVLVTTTKDVVVGQDANGADIVESRKVTEWKDPKQVVSNTLTAKNGINVVNDADGNSEFKLGGALTEAKTTITTTDTNVLAIEGLDAVEKGKVLENNLVIADKDGVLKQTSAKNLIEDAVEKGDLVAKNLTSESIVVTGGESSVLKDTQLEIKGGSSEGQVLVTTQKVDDQGKPVTDAAGNPVYTTKWVDAAGNTVKSGQGVTVGTDNTVNLGGKITNIGTTPGAVIDLTDDKGTKAGDIAIKGLEDLVGKDATTGTKLDTNTDNLVIADANGVLKQTSAKNLIEDAVGKGDLEAKTLKGDGITVTSGATAGTDTSVANSLLKDVTLGIAKGAVTSDKMRATVVDPNGGSTNAEAGMVPVANADGTVTYDKLDAKDVIYTKPAGEDNGLTSNTVEGVINELAGKKGDLKVAGTMLKVDENAKGALRHDATISLDLAGVNKIVETNVDYTAKVEDVIILASATNGDLTVTLPEASANKGKKYTIKKHDTNEDGYVIVEGNIIGVAQGKKLETGLPYSGWDFVSDGTQWQIVNKF